MTTDVLRYTAFTADPAGGNPAGVVLDATGWTDDRMQAVAAEVGYSETAFVLPGPDPRQAVLRYFSPLAEVAFCGHATVATAAALTERHGAGDYVFSTPAGVIPVHTRITDGVASATLTSVPTSFTPVSPGVLTEVLTYLNWHPRDLDPGHPPVVAFGGGHHLVLATRTRKRLANLSYEFGPLAGLMRQENWTTLQLVYFDPDGTIHSRNPFPVGGVVEDPATGAAAAALGGYLRPNLDRPALLTIRQGEDMGRPSLLVVEIDPADPRIRVTGQAVPLPG
ncbi:PhzF family phenazine biosynthesis isomerase [Crossiella sp. CA-258035]|uniref:PhzF family phenazine biosynthesis protein n=1 Tax=Crossiella sp. CA-258035 TaxID=2981138 RepID=UPI0024BC2F20|nr:PhzF family phenazine biosynthesis isomerase [Crossiella sp. CA-258035]WHT22234.1 PhzF family phenazine biosynthesis isomerase [Crossiella sp. CA-258035]